MEYTDVFSRRDGEMRLTKVISHKILLTAGIAPIRQPTRRLGPEKSRQVQDLLEKDGSWRFCVDYCKLNSATI